LTRQVCSRPNRQTDSSPRIRHERPFQVGPYLAGVGLIVNVIAIPDGFAPQILPVRDQKITEF
jgi:hypothetical protein